jgi:hypothetical protein
MQATLTEVNIRRMVQLLRNSATNHDKLLADYLEGFLKTKPVLAEVDLDEIPF